MARTAEEDRIAITKYNRAARLKVSLLKFGHDGFKLYTDKYVDKYQQWSYGNYLTEWIIPRQFALVFRHVLFFHPVKKKNIRNIFLVHVTHVFLLGRTKRMHNDLFISRRSVIIIALQRQYYNEIIGIYRGCRSQMKYGVDIDHNYPLRSFAYLSEPCRDYVPNETR